MSITRLLYRAVAFAIMLCGVVLAQQFTIDSLRGQLIQHRDIAQGLVNLSLQNNIPALGISFAQGRVQAHVTAIEWTDEPNQTIEQIRGRATDRAAYYRGMAAAFEDIATLVTPPSP